MPTGTICRSCRKSISEAAWKPPGLQLEVSHPLLRAPVPQDPVPVTPSPHGCRRTRRESLGSPETSVAAHRSPSHPPLGALGRSCCSSQKLQAYRRKGRRAKRRNTRNCREPQCAICSEKGEPEAAARLRGEGACREASGTLRLAPGVDRRALLGSRPGEADPAVRVSASTAPGTPARLSLPHPAGIEHGKMSAAFIALREALLASRRGCLRSSDAIADPFC